MKSSIKIIELYNLDARAREYNVDVSDLPIF